MKKMNSFIHNNLQIKFTWKIILLSIFPILFISVIFLTILPNKIDQLNDDISAISTNRLDSIYIRSVTEKNKNVKDKVSLKLESILNDLNVLRATAQGLIDKDKEKSLNLSPEYDAWVTQHMVYNAKKNWSNLSNNDFNVSMSVWGYLHNKDGLINQMTRNYLSLMVPVLPVLQSVGENGVKKGWYYVIGPKETPVMIMSPWAQMPEIFDERYPGHNENNWWDFFFPGIVESWQKWAQDPSGGIRNTNEQVTVTPLYEDAGGTGLMITFFAPLWNKDRTRNFGAAAVDYNISNLTSLTRGENPEDESFSFLLQSNGNILDASDEIIDELVLSQITSSSSGVEVSVFNLSTSTIKELAELPENLTQTNGSSLIEFSHDGKSYLISSSELISYNLWDGQKIVQDKLYVVTILPKDEILNIKNGIVSEVNRLSLESREFIFTLSLLIAIVSIIFSAWLAVRNTRQIRLISQGLTQVSQKNYNLPIDVISTDELGNLAETFNQMIREISKSRTELENYASELEEKIQERTIHLEEVNRKLEQLNQIDGLTKIYNRRYFDENLDKVWREYSRLNHPISIIMMDIDYFKKYNDYYGHQEGDTCLCLVASSLQQQLNRSSDLVARYGGEEFIALACVGINDVSELAEKFRNAIEGLFIEHRSSEKGFVTISVGCASTIPSQTKKISKLIEAADMALYESKQNGRNRISMKDYDHQ